MGRKKGQRRRNPKPQLQDVPGSRTPSFSHESLEKTIDKEVAANNRPDPINSAERSVSESVHSSVSERSGAIDNVMSTLQSSQWIGNGSSQPPQPFHEAPPQPVLTSVPPPAVPFPPKSLPLSTPPPPFRQNQNPVNPPPFLCPSDSSYPPEANEYGFGEINVLHSMPQPSQTQFVSRTEGIHTRLGEEQQLSSVAVQQNQTPRQLEDHKNTLAGTEGNSPTAHFRPPDTTQRPPDTSQRPPDTSQRPPDTSHRPPDTTQRPPDTSQRPPDTSQRPPENYFSHPAQPITPPGFHPGLSAIHHSPPHAGLHLTSPQAGAQGTVWTPQMPPPPLPFWHAGPLVSQPCNPNNRQQGFSDFPGFPGMYPSLGPHQFTYGMQYPHPMCMIPAAGQQLRGGAEYADDGIDTFPQNARKMRVSHTRSKRSRSSGMLLKDENEDTSDTSTGSENEEAPLPQTIKIRGVQNSLMATKCKYYFQNPNKGGGAIQDAKWDNIDHIYYIKFKDPKVARKLASSVHKLDGRQLEISFAPTGIPESVGLRTVEISGIDVELLEVYQLYFENPDNGGGTISKMWEDRQTQKLYITFEDAAVAEVVCTTEHTVEERVLQAKLANMEHLTGAASDVTDLAKGSTTMEVPIGQPLKAAETVCSQQQAEQRVVEANLATSDVMELDEAVVEATVGQPLKDEKFYRQYFETCQEGGPVKDLILNEENGKVMVIFDSPTVAQRVSSARHRIDGKDVQVSILRRPPFYSDKLLLRNVAREATKELLMAYLEIVSGQDGIAIVYGDEPENVLAAFAKKIDFRKIEEKCQVKLLCGRRVQVCRVPVSNCILVENLSEDSTDDDVAGYFESPRAEGGTVLKVQLAEKHSKCVFFEDPEVIPRVVMKKHFLRGRQLGVRLYLECLGLSGGREDPYVFVLPGPLELSARNNIKILFLRHCNAMLQVFNEHLSKVHGRASIADDILRVDCTLNKNLPKVHLLVSTWREDINKQLQICFDLVSLYRQEVLPEVWLDVKKAAEKSIKSQDDLLLTCQEENAILVLSRCSTGVDTFKKIQGIVADTEKELTFKKLEVTETRKLQRYELDLVTMSSFVSDAKEQYRRLRVAIREEEGTITFCGQPIDVKDAQNKMLEILRSAASKILNLTDSKIKVLSCKQSRDTVDRKMKMSRLSATWDCREEGVVAVYSVKQSDVQRAVQLIQTSLIEEDLTFDEETVELMASQSWKTLRKTLIQDNNGAVAINAQVNSIRITAVSDSMPPVKEAIQSFIAENIIYSVVFRFSPSRQKFVGLFWKDMLNIVAGKLSQYEVHITLDEQRENIHVKGIRLGITCARKELESLEEKIVCTEEIITRKEVVAFLTNPDNTRDVECTARAHQCVLSQSPEGKGIQVVSTNQRAKQTHKAESHCLVSAVLTDITRLPVDAVVNAANERMQHSGGLAGAIVSKGGNEIQEECYRLLRTRGPISEGDVLVSGPGKLPCKAIIHAVGPQYKGGNAGEEERLRTVVLRCLLAASERGFTSIALPAISSGIFGYPVNEATRVIVDAVRDFLDSNLDTSIRDVRLCDVQQSTVNLFRIALDAPSFQRKSTTIIRDPQLRALGDSKMHGSPVKNSLAKSSGITVSVVEGELAKQTAVWMDSSEVSATEGATSLRDWDQGDSTEDFDFGELRLTIKQGDITEQDVDAIVNSSNAGLDLSRGAVSNVLKTKCGVNLQVECDSKRAVMEQQKAVVTAAYSLKCRHIIHIDAHHYSSVGDWEKAYTVLLQTAEKSGICTLAVPALGTGNYNLPAASSAQALAKALTANKQTLKTLRTVSVVLFDSNSFLAFVDSLKEEANKNRFVTSRNPLQPVPKKSVFQRITEKIGGALRLRKTTVPDALKLYIFTTDRESRDAFLKAFHNMVDAKYKSKKIRDVEKLSQEEREEITKACKPLDVEVHWDTNKGTTELKGMEEDVEKCREIIQNVLKETERERQESVVAYVIQWYYLKSKTTGTERTAFGKRENLQIEEAFQAFQTNQTKDSVEINDDKGGTQVVTFTDEKMTSKVNPSDSAKVMRQEIIKDGAGSVSLLPERWDFYDGGTVRLVPLQAGCDEYNSVRNNLARTAKEACSITSIERIQNPELYLQYSAKKKQMEKQNKGFVSERTLWHGTSADTLQNINLYGFNRSFCGKNAYQYGQGVYFAVNSAYSMKDTYSSPDSSGNKNVYQCKVLVGYSTTGNHNMKTLPLRQTAIPYDSATNNESSPAMYVIFHDSQAYPEYLIKFVKTP